MKENYCLLAVEGVHDQAAVARILEISGFKKFKGEYNELDRFWDDMIPTYPKPDTLSRKRRRNLSKEQSGQFSEGRSGQLYARMNMPSILTTETHSVAIYAGGGSNLVGNLAEIIDLYPQYAEKIQAFGLLVDSDKKQPDKIAKDKAEDLKHIFPMISSQPGTITVGPPRTGIYVLPDNKRSGVLDSILTDCASVVYPDHKKAADNFLDSLDEAHTKHFRPFDKEKALIACIVSVLKPGMSNTSSIAQDKWICDHTIDAVSDIRLLCKFLKDLLDLN
jgi:hypothetical protein